MAREPRSWLAEVPPTTEVAETFQVAEMLSDSSDNEESYKLTINDHYAKAYQQRKEREELQKREFWSLETRARCILHITDADVACVVKDKYGSDFDEEEEGSDESTDSESAESEDEDGQELTPAVDAAILRTLAMIKRKDPSIYVPGKDVYIGACYASSIKQLNI